MKYFFYVHHYSILTCGYNTSVYSMPRRRLRFIRRRRFFNCLISRSNWSARSNPPFSWLQDWHMNCAFPWYDRLSDVSMRSRMARFSTWCRGIHRNVNGMPQCAHCPRQASHSLVTSSRHRSGPCDRRYRLRRFARFMVRSNSISIGSRARSSAFCTQYRS